MLRPLDPTAMREAALREAKVAKAQNKNPSRIYSALRALNNYKITLALVAGAILLASPYGSSARAGLEQITCIALQSLKSLVSTPEPQPWYKVW